MEKVQLFEKLNENIQNLEDIENEISMLQLATYQKNIEKLKECKIDEIKELFEQNSRFYNQKSERYRIEIEKNINDYKEQLENLINVYDNLYVNTFRIMQNAINNQKITMANIVILTERLQKGNLTEEEIQKTKNNVIACAQKKLNYAVIIDECKARINWCIENVQIDINEVFKNNIYQLQIYEENIFTKIRKLISNKISGRNKFRKFLEDYKNEDIKNLRIKNALKVLDVVSVLKGVIRQMEEVKEQISVQYKQMIYS